MVIGQINYYSCLYESKNDYYHGYNAIIEIPRIKMPSLYESIVKKEMEKTGVSGSFLNIIRTIKTTAWEGSIGKRKDRNIVGIRDYGNMLVVAIKVGGVYQFKSYSNFSFEPNGYIEIEPLEFIQDGTKNN